MGTFSVETMVAAPVSEVWTALADIGAIYKWNPGVIDSHITSDIPQGEGSSRYCDLGRGNYLYESVVKLSEKDALTMRITKTNLPFKKADIRFSLRPEDGGTRVTVSPIYEIKFGVLGLIFDRVYVRKTYHKGMKALLEGLREYIESEVEVHS